MAMRHPLTSRCRIPVFALLVLVAFIGWPNLARPAAVPTGSAEGRVIRASDGRYLANARVSVQGSDQRVLTDSAGEYRLAGLPVGEVRLW